MIEPFGEVDGTGFKFGLLRAGASGGLREGIAGRIITPKSAPVHGHKEGAGADSASDLNR